MMKTVSLTQATNHIIQGDIVGIPTETVYGLGADATNPQAVQKIFQLKKRPAINPLIVHILEQSWAEAFAYIPNHAAPLLKKFWPGPLTIVVPLKKNVPIARLVTAGLETIALRVPAHPVFRDLLQKVQKPIAAPSANPSEHLSCTKPEDLIRSFGEACPPILDASMPCAFGLESTIIDLSTKTPTLLRHGAIPLEKIARFFPSIETSSTLKKIKAPGQLKRHYAPKKPLRLNAVTIQPDELFLNFGQRHPEEDLNLSSLSDLEEAAKNLFWMLHQLDQMDLPKIAVAPIPERDIGVAINDRLKRAAYTSHKRGS